MTNTCIHTAPKGKVEKNTGNNPACFHDTPLSQKGTNTGQQRGRKTSKQNRNY